MDLTSNPPTSFAKTIWRRHLFGEDILAMTFILRRHFVWRQHFGDDDLATTIWGPPTLEQLLACLCAVKVVLGDDQQVKCIILLQNTRDKCSKCRQPIVGPSSTLRNKGITLHQSCFRCCRCGNEITGTYYEVDGGKFMCKDDYIVSNYVLFYHICLWLRRYFY